MKYFSRENDAEVVKLEKQDDVIVSFVIPHKGREGLLEETLRGIS